MTDPTVGRTLLIVLGVIVCVTGALIVRFRVKVNEGVRRSQERLLGRTAARFSAGRQTPLGMGIVGVLWVLVGAYMVVLGLCKILGIM